MDRNIRGLLTHGKEEDSEPLKSSGWTQGTPRLKSGSWVSSLCPTAVIGINQGSPGQLVYHFPFIESHSLMVMHRYLS